MHESPIGSGFVARLANRNSRKKIDVAFFLPTDLWIHARAIHAVRLDNAIGVE